MLNEPLRTISAATNTALDQKHLLGDWKEIDPEGRVVERYWALCLKCGDSIFTYQDGSYRGLESQCSKYQEVGFTEGGADSLTRKIIDFRYEENRPTSKHVVFRPSVMNYCLRSFPSS
ncbi:hypothetical protein LCGC14_0994240 [marine sediment metagenome]|uniref:Uncharacterized protein n=1 Tax=marine sediment metagenome TaxID=412755 RepID=A0A0F9RBA9_9ZZZZ